jgi:hypothetical protein
LVALRDMRPRGQAILAITLFKNGWTNFASTPGSRLDS